MLCTAAIRVFFNISSYKVGSERCASSGLKYVVANLSIYAGATFLLT